MLKKIVALSILILPLPALAIDLSVKVEPGLAIQLTRPQSELFDLGGAASVSVLFGLTSYLDIGPSATFVLSPASTSGADAGTAWAFGGGLRLKRPHEPAGPERTLLGASPWLHADGLYVRTGDRDRPGFALAAGVAFPLDGDSRFWLGPFARYLQIIQGERAGFDNHDDKILIVGLSLEIGGAIRHEATPAPVAEAAPVAAAPPVAAPPPVETPPPVVATAPPPPPPVVEITQKVHFDYDRSALKPESYPALNEVARELRDHKDYRIQVQGHADSRGTDDYNQPLSERRAAVVVKYLVAHGVARDRLEAKGYGSSMPVDTNETAEGREHNRRVTFIILIDGGGR